MTVRITAIDNQPLGPSAGIEVHVQRGDSQAYTAQPELRQRAYLHPSRDGTSLGSRSRTLTIQRKRSATHHQIMTIFRPRREMRRLFGVSRFGGEEPQEVYMDVDVTSLVRHSPNQYTAEVVSTTGYWLSVDERDDAEGINPAGNIESRPRLLLSGGIQVPRHRFILVDQNGRGVHDFLWRLNVPGGSSSPGNYDVYMNRRRVPFYVSGAGQLWLRVTVPPRRVGTALRSTFIDVYHGAGINNQITAQMLDPSGINLAASTNTHLVVDSLRLEEHLSSATGVVRPALQGEIGQGGAVLVSQSDGEATFQINTRGERRRNGMEILNGVGFGAGASISGLHREWQAQTGFHVRHFVRYMTRSGIWQTAYTDTALGSPGSQAREEDEDISLPAGAFQVVIGIDANPALFHLEEYNQAAGSLTLSLSGSMTISRNSAELPGVQSAGSTNARYINGSVSAQPSGDTIHLDTLYFDAGEFVIDCAERDVYAEQGPHYIRDKRRTNPHDWIRLVPGTANTISAPDGVSVDVHWRDRWIED